jgi:fused signal recognition particle receptor
MTEGNAGWLSRLKAGLSKTSAKLSDGIAGVFTKRKLDAETLDKLEELLVQADMGATTAASIVSSFGQKRLGKDITQEEVKQELANEIAQILAPVAKPLVIDKNRKPHVVLVVGVNGNGKTTTVGKLAHSLKRLKYSVILAAADTFRAAAVEQLKVWGERTGCEVVAGEPEADPASVAYRACEKAKAEQADVLLIDSAGRLHNKANLMAELQKIIKVIRKIDPEAPHSVILVLDATTGQNALNQTEVFKTMVDVTGLIVTKLDGTAKGGIVVAIADRFGLPVHAIGVGEGIDDFKSFAAEDFARNLVAA